MKRIIFYGLLLCFLVLSNSVLLGCKASEPELPAVKEEPEIVSVPTDKPVSTVSTQNSPISPLPAPTATKVVLHPSAGKSAIQGRIIIKTTGGPLVGTALYLTPGVGENKNEVPPAFSGAREDNFQGFTDDNGYFVINEVPSGAYYIFVWAPLNWILVSDDTTVDGSQPMQFNLQPDQVLDLTEIVLDWP